MNRGKRVRVPLIRQVTISECGVACLAMVFAYHKKKVSLEEIRDVCAVSSEGVTARRLVSVAESYGFISKGFRGVVNDLKESSLPCILLWDVAHFVVLTGFSVKSFYLNDPLVGKIKISSDLFAKYFSGVYLTFELL